MVIASDIRVGNVIRIDGKLCKVLTQEIRGTGKFGKSAMLKLLDDSGFVPRRVRDFNLRDNAPALVSSLFPSLDPVSRAVRHRKRNVRESVPVAWTRHLIYLLFVFAAYPLAILESAFGRGATVMIEAAKK